MSFEYLAYTLPHELVGALIKKPESFLNVFFESNYADDFAEVEEECEEDVEGLSPKVAQAIFQHVQFLAENEEESLDLDGEYWAAPVNFFLTQEFDEDDALPQPNFTTKVHGTYTLINALAGVQTIETDNEVVLLTPYENIAEILTALENLLKDDFKKRWVDFTTEAGQYADIFDGDEELEEFIADLREFTHEVLIPFYKNALDKKQAIIVLLD